MKKNRSIRNRNRSGNHPRRWLRLRTLAQQPPASKIGRPHLTSPSAVGREAPFPRSLCYVYLTYGFSQAGKFRLSPLPHRVHRSHPRLKHGPSCSPLQALARLPSQAASGTLRPQPGAPRSQTDCPECLRSLTEYLSAAPSSALVSQTPLSHAGNPLQNLLRR